jgi:ATP-binding cassette, subfamily B, bacterial PglK
MINTVRRTFSLLTPRERRQVYWFSGGLLGIALIQIASIASVMPFMAVVGEPDVIQRNPSLFWLYSTLGFRDQHSFLIFLGVLVFVVLITSNLLSAFMEWRVLRFTWVRGHTLALRLLKKYVRQPYPLFLEQHSANLSKNIFSEVSQVINGILLPLMETNLRFVRMARSGGVFQR